MTRRDLLPATAGAAASALALNEASAQEPALDFQSEKSGLKITGLRLVEGWTRKRFAPYSIAHERWSAPQADKSLPMNKYGTGRQSAGATFDPNLPLVPGVAGAFTVQITTDKGVTGYGRGGNGGTAHVLDLAKWLVGQDPFDVARLWDVMYLNTLTYGRAGAAVHAISGVDLALWDIIGKATGMPVYKLIGGATKPRIPSYATLNDVLWKKKIGFKRIKLALPYGPLDGRNGLKKNAELVQYTREQLGPDGEIMLDCWMSLTEPYTLELADAVAPYNVYWIEEPLMADDYEGHARLKAQIKTCKITTGEHLYTRYEFKRLAQHSGAHIWQPDIQWCGGLTELMRIAAIASAYDTPVIPHLGGSSPFATHFIMATPNSPWAEFFWPPAGGPEEVYSYWEQEHLITRGPEGIYTRPLDRPGFGWDIVAE
jgi:L-alanine-DL-glutamate epimerase-like enolase superfamily enzyme